MFAAKWHKKLDSPETLIKNVDLCGFPVNIPDYAQVHYPKYTCQLHKNFQETILKTDSFSKINSKAWTCIQTKHTTCDKVRGKSHWKSSRWFLPFFVSYRSIAVGCELSLCPEKRTYKNDVRRYCVGFLALWPCRDVLDSQSRRLQWSALSDRNVRLQGPELLVLPHCPFHVLLTAPRFASRHGIKR